MTHGPNTKHLLLILSFHLTWKMQNLKLHVIFLSKLKGQAEALQGGLYLHSARPKAVSHQTADLGWPCAGAAGGQARDSQQSSSLRLGGHCQPPISPPPELHNLALRTFKGWAPESTSFCSIFIFPYPSPLCLVWLLILYIQTKYICIYKKKGICVCIHVYVFPKLHHAIHMSL